MAQLSTWVSLVVLVLCAVTSVRAFHPAPVFTLDLGLPPAQRWKGAVSLILSKHTWVESFDGFLKRSNATVFQYMTAAERSTVVNNVKNMFPEKYGELQGLAEEFAKNGHSEITVEFLALSSWWHELAHASDLPQGELQLKECTGILVLPEDESQPIIHGRNLDQAGYNGRNMTLQIHIVNSSSADPSKVLYQAVDIYWYCAGFVTATGIGKVTLEENWRFADRNPPQNMSTIIARISIGVAMPQAFMYRYVMEELLRDVTGPTAFDLTVDFLLRATFAAPFYAIVSGEPRAGAVLSVAWNQTESVAAYLNVPSRGSDNKTWHLVQTNDDRWNGEQPPPSWHRRTFARSALESLGRKDAGTKLGVWMSISEFPVHNPGTMYTVLMDVRSPTRGFIRFPMFPMKGFWPTP